MQRGRGVGHYNSSPVCYTAGDAAQDAQNGSGGLEALALAQRIVDVAADRQASDILMLDLRALSPIADYFVICSGTSERHIEAIDREIVDRLRRDEHLRPRQREGDATSGWVLLDYGDVVVHILSPDERDFYQLEDLWSSAPTVVRVQ